MRQDGLFAEVPEDVKTLHVVERRQVADDRELAGALVRQLAARQLQ